MEKIRSDVIAIGALLALALTNIITPTEAIAGFSNSVGQPLVPLDLTYTHSIFI